ncbi:hypothetical protein [Pseudohoeflea coraliihabitans]|uniref:Apea-like HEPN domain-containing protein n=1 Tax=Pseudohoeflea coraliihabitans TaxID=2860393 RepID=A0ABS6WP31_9HYPH|nr:hypothetical protein [Pseudohoeflea sp. DP4N28-3]MBW3097520.1 hypothetical protein [Pseudohoeflea sp. DP4N28-3]
MTSLLEHIEDVLAELRRIRVDPRFPREEDGFPGLIDAGDKGSILVSQAIEQSISKISDILLQNDKGAARQFSNTEWRNLVRRSLGKPLAEVDLHDPSAANRVRMAVRNAIGRTRDGHGFREYAVGCTLFENVDIEPINIGPVQIEPRLRWLSRMAAEDKIDKIIERRVRRKWAGKKLPKRKNAIDQIREKDILQIVGTCPFVCSVSTNGLPPESGKQKALIAGRMALAVISLEWAKPSAALDGFRLQVDQNLRRFKVLTFEPGKVTLAGFKLSHLPMGYRFEPGEWDQGAEKRAPIFDIVGEVLQYVVHETGAVPRPAISNVLMQAILWFHEACREAVDAMAVVKFVSTLDGLAGGNGEQEIRKLLSARIGWKADDQILKNQSLTLKQAVNRVYGEGRSRIVHGVSYSLSHDLSEMRNLAEMLARCALIGCLQWAKDNPTSDEPSKFYA